MSQTLKEQIADFRNEGFSNEQIINALRSSWPEEAIMRELRPEIRTPAPKTDTDSFLNTAESTENPPISHHI